MSGNMNRPKQSKQSNKEILIVTYSFAVLFLAVLVHLVYFAATSGEEMLNNSYNGRQALLAAQNVRGTIYAGSGEVLAETVTAADGTETRQYPYGNLFAHAVGYSTKGRTGIEAQANYYLMNSNLPLQEKVRYESAGEKTPADSVVTTLDTKLQQVLDRELGIYKGAAVVMNPSTGEILALASNPDYDPNEIQEIWEDLVNNKNSTVLLNRATQGLYPPGSTFKIITALEYMRQNPDTYADFKFECNGSYTADGNTIRCYHGTKHGMVDFETAFAKSCNAAFASMGMQLDRTAFSKTLDQLLFNAALPVNMSYKQSTIQMSATISDEDMIQSAIGQGKTQMTPMHLCMITSAAANGGVLMKPYMIDSVKTKNGEIVKQFQPEAYGSIMTGEEAAELSVLMEEVVRSGTGRKLSDVPYTAAGKTGSAEYNANGDSHAWFTGFAPAENPQIAVTIMIESAGSGGDYAVPIARRIFDAYFEESSHDGM